MSISRTIAIAAPLLLAISACNDDPAVDVENDGREASGEVLEGTISDAMLPLDQVRSQAPLVEEAEEPAGGDSTPASAAPAEPAPAEEAPAEAAPADGAE